MFAWKERREFRDELRQLTDRNAAYKGPNRRAIGLIPPPIKDDLHETLQSAHTKYQQLLISMEAKQSTCCLRIIAPARKCRAAVLVYEGRVLGAIYGKKGMKDQLFDKAAFLCAIAELSYPGNILDTYILTKEIALAAASLFHGSIMAIPDGLDKEELYDLACGLLIKSGNPGCVIITTPDKCSVCMVYIYGGKAVGVYSHQDGWVGASEGAGLSYLRETEGAQVSASMLTAKTVEEIRDLTMSLTGLNGALPAEAAGA